MEQGLRSNILGGRGALVDIFNCRSLQGAKTRAKVHLI